MTLTNLFKAPFPYYGGKADAAPAVWAALGDVDHYVEPFMGSLAVLLRRPHEANRTYHSETVNDLDGFLVNAWRAIQLHPDATADAASWPVSEADMHARHLALLRWREERQLEHLMGDPVFCDPMMAGWWIQGISNWIGSGWCSGTGPWVVGEDGRITKRSGGVKRKLPHVADDGKGVNRPQSREPGVARQLPHVADDGKGVNRPQAREPGVARQRPHVANDGQGVNHAGTREPGVARQRPHVSSDGQGVNSPQAREPGVARQLPHVADDGKGVNHAGTREPGVARQLPHVSDNGKGVNHAGTREPGVCDDASEFHPMTMPEVRRWFAFLSARLRHVRILNGDWRRAVTSGVCKTLGVRMGGGVCGVFVDPPYADTAERDMTLYAHDSGTVAHDVRAWCLENGADPQLRIALAGYEGEHGTALTDAGWREVEWFSAGFCKGGMAQQSDEGHQQGRERLWLSPHCIAPVTEAPRQRSLFDAEGR